MAKQTVSPPVDSVGLPAGFTVLTNRTTDRIEILWDAKPQTFEPHETKVFESAVAYAIAKRYAYKYDSGGVPQASLFSMPGTEFEGQKVERSSTDLIKEAKAQWISGMKVEVDGRMCALGEASVDDLLGKSGDANARQSMEDARTGKIVSAVLEQLLPKLQLAKA